MMSDYKDHLVELFRRNSDPENALPMKKYMKHKFQFLGIKTPLRKELTKAFFQKYGKPEVPQLKDIVLHLWELPEREFQYFSIGLLRKTVAKVPEDFIDLYEHLIITKSWWDTVDGIASWLVGKHLQRFPGLRDRYLEKWLGSDNFWLQRTCLLFQLGYKEKTDFELLKKLIIPLAKEQEFFLRKAIGWALREYSKIDHKSVIAFVENNELSALSRKEAYKWIQRKGII